MDIHAPSIAILVMTALVFLSYLFLCGRCEDLRQEVAKQEAEKENAHRREMAEQMKWDQLKSIDHIRPLLKRHGMDMDWPDEAHVFRVPKATWAAYQNRRMVERIAYARTDAVEADHE